MTVKVVEYIHEYTDRLVDFPAPGEDAVEYSGRVRERYYAVLTDNSWVEIPDGSWKVRNYTVVPSAQINGTNLNIYGRDDLEGYIGLLTKLLDELPEKEDK